MKFNNINTIYFLFKENQKHDYFIIFKTSQKKYFILYEDYPFYFEIKKPRDTIHELISMYGYQIISFYKATKNRK